MACLSGGLRCQSASSSQSIKLLVVVGDRRDQGVEVYGTCDDTRLVSITDRFPYSAAAANCGFDAPAPTSSVCTV